MTWRELKEVITNMDDRFLDTQVELYDHSTGETIFPVEVYNDCTEDDYTIDANQPQIFFNVSEDEDG